MKFQHCQILLFNWLQSNPPDPPNPPTYTHILTHTIKPQTWRSVQPGPNVCMGIGPMCVSECVSVSALMESQSGKGIEVTEVNKEEENIKKWKRTQGCSHFFTKIAKKKVN